LNIGTNKLLSLPIAAGKRRGAFIPKGWNMEKLKVAVIGLGMGKGHVKQFA